MPPEILPPIALICAFFLTFMVGIAYGCIASNLPEKKGG